MRVPLKGGVSVRTVMEDGEEAKVRGWMDMRVPRSHQPSGNRATVWKCHSRVGWVLGPSSPTSLMRGPFPGVGAQGQWATEAAGDKPN